MTVLPEMATDEAKKSDGSSPEAVSLAVCIWFCQPPGGSVNTYTAPWKLPFTVVAPPVTTVRPDIAITPPRKEPPVPSEAVSLAAWVSSCQPPAGLVNTYTAPWPELPLTVARGAPPTMTLPEIPTENPMMSFGPASEAVSLAAWVSSCQPVLGLVNTYTAPGTLPDAPATTVFPLAEMATPFSPSVPLLPRLSKAAPSEAVSLAAWVASCQPPGGLVNTYTAPWPGLPFTVAAAPATIVFPLAEMATESPR